MHGRDAQHLRDHLDGGSDTLARGRVLVTGARGFVGSALIPALRARGWRLRAAVRPGGTVCDAEEEITVVPFEDVRSWGEALHGVDCIVHLAARVHVMNDTVADPLSAFRKVNVGGTRALARAAADAGVRRFVFISSIKVNGESTTGRAPFTELDTPAPLDAYGVSKHEAEEALFALAGEGRMEVVVIRPPLVYGPGVKANFLALMRWLHRGVPLPLGAVHNRRTLVALGNLVDLIAICLEHPQAANQVFLVGDGEDLSTTELLRRLATAIGVSARLVPVPATWIHAAATVLGKGNVAQRLCGDLQLDISKARHRLGWTPPVTVAEGLEGTAAHFLRRIGS